MTVREFYNFCSTRGITDYKIYIDEISMSGCFVGYKEMNRDEINIGYGEKMISFFVNKSETAENLTSKENEMPQEFYKADINDEGEGIEKVGEVTLKSIGRNYNESNVCDFVSILIANGYEVHIRRPTIDFYKISYYKVV